MEQRKIMSLGRASLVVSLPKNWVKSNKLKKGDTISVDVQRDNSLVISPSARMSKEPKKGSLYIEPDEKEDTIARRLVSYYLNGYSNIEMRSRKVFSAEQIKAIRRIVGILYMSIMESDSERMSIETLLDESKASVVSSIQRMHMIALSMCQDTLKAFRNQDSSLADAVMSLDDDVDQFSYLILRLLRGAAIDPMLANQLSLEPIQCLDYQTVVHRIEYVANKAKNISRYITKLMEGKQWISERLLAILLKSGVDAIESYNTAVYSFLSRDTSSCDQILDCPKRIEEEDLARMRALILLTEKKNELLICAICSICDNIRGIAEHAADIAEANLRASLVVQAPR